MIDWNLMRAYVQRAVTSAPFEVSPSRVRIIAEGMAPPPMPWEIDPKLPEKGPEKSVRLPYFEIPRSSGKEFEHWVFAAELRLVSVTYTHNGRPAFAGTNPGSLSSIVARATALGHEFAELSSPEERWRATFERLATNSAISLPILMRELRARAARTLNARHKEHP